MQETLPTKYNDDRNGEIMIELYVRCRKCGMAKRLEDFDWNEPCAFCGGISFQTEEIE